MKKIIKNALKIFEPTLQTLFPAIERYLCRIANTASVHEIAFVSRPTNITLLIKQRLFQEKVKRLPIIAVFFDLENLDKSAISIFSIQTFGADPGKFHIFTKISTNDKANEILTKISDKLNIESQQLAIFDTDAYEEMDQYYQYQANIFILGDSAFNIKAFESAIKMHKDKHRNYLYFHDGIYINLLQLWAARHGSCWNTLLESFYPEHVNTNHLSMEELLSRGIYMIKPIIKLTGCNKIIINANNCLPMIEKEVGALHVIKAFLAISDHKKSTVVRNVKSTFIVAHFGIPNDFKQLDKVIASIQVLHQQGHSIKLLLAGYGVKEFVKKLPYSQKKLIIIKDSPPFSEMLSLMHEVDIIVQLRWPIMGQASGVVNEVIGLGYRCITTKGFVNDHFKDYVIEVPDNIAPEALSKIILSHRGKTTIPLSEHADLLTRYSNNACAELIFNSIVNPLHKMIT